MHEERASLPSPIVGRDQDQLRAEVAARDLRKVLSLPAGPAWNLPAIAERAGLYAFTLDLGDESLDGSYVRLEKAGVALVNGGRQTGRRRFTLVHELGHHLFADDFSPEWIVGADGDDRERLINAFVIHFLLPRESIQPRWQELGGRNDARTAAIVLGAEFGASWTAVLGQWCNLELIDSQLRERLERDRPSKADYLEGGVTLREELSPPAVPPRFAQAVVRAYKRHKISARRLSSSCAALWAPSTSRPKIEFLRTPCARSSTWTDGWRFWSSTVRR